MPVTISDVAQYAGVSVGSVSAYINGKKMRPKNEKKIKDAIDILGYQPNISARGLKSHRTLCVGILIDSLSDAFSAAIAEAAESILVAHGYTVLLCSFHGDVGREEQKLRYLLDKQVDGALLYLSGEHPYALEEYARRKVPFVLINEDVEAIRTDKVFINNFKAGFQATERLRQEGHRRVAVIAGSETDFTSRGRIDGYRKALEIGGLPFDPELVRYGRYSCKGAYQAVLELLALPAPPTAVFTTSYHMTLGAVMAVNESNRHIPDDISLVGFDRFELSDVIKPRLTVMEQPMEKMGILAAELLLRRLSGDYADFPQVRELEATLCAGCSVRRIHEE